MHVCGTILLVLIFTAVETINAQNHPLFLHDGQTLPNHTYVDITGVSTTFRGTVQCETDFSECCTSAHGDFRGQWSFPNGDNLPVPQQPGIFMAAELRRIHLRRQGNITMPTGIYRCAIPTLAVHDENDSSVRAVIFAGIYTPDTGDISISGDMTLMVESDLNGLNPQFTLTCISTGGPATIVTWTRDSTTITEGTVTVLNDRITAKYTHTLTVTGRQPGLYSCTVSNNKPSSASRSLRIGVGSTPTNLRYEIQKGSTGNILIFWDSPSPLEDTTGYNILLTGKTITHSIVITNISRNSLPLAGIESGEVYNLSIFGLSHYNSEDALQRSIIIDTDGSQSLEAAVCEPPSENEAKILRIVLGVVTVASAIIIVTLLILVIRQRHIKQKESTSMRRDSEPFRTSTNESYSVLDISIHKKTTAKSLGDREGFQTTVNEAYSETGAEKNQNTVSDSYSPSETQKIYTWPNESYIPTEAARFNTKINESYGLIDATQLKTSINECYSIRGATAGDYESVDDEK